MIFTEGKRCPSNLQFVQQMQHSRRCLSRVIPIFPERQNPVISGAKLRIHRRRKSVNVRDCQ